MANAKNVSADNIRDLAIMARQGKGFAYIREVFGWSDELLQELCRAHDITIADAPVRKLSVRARPTREPPPRAYARREASAVRSITLSAVTTPRLAMLIAIEAERRHAAKGHILHLILERSQARGLWPLLLADDDPQQQEP